MTFWETGVGLWSTAHFVYNSDGSRGGARGARYHTLFLDQNEAQRAEKKFFGDQPPDLPYLKVWIRHCILNSYYSPVPLKPLLAL